MSYKQSPKILSVVFPLLVAVTTTAATPNPYRAAPKLQEVVAPFWTAEPAWETELQLKNNLASGSLSVTPVLRLASGREIPLDTVVISSNASAFVSVNDSLQRHSPTLLSKFGSYGSVVFRFVSFNAENLHATAVLHLQGAPIAFPVRAHPVWQVEPQVRSDRAGSLEGIWWQPRSGLNDVLVISNGSEKKISGTLSLFDAAGNKWNEPLSFQPHQTRRMDTSDLLRKSGLRGSYGGIRFEVPASAPALDGVHLMYDDVGKFSMHLEMLNRDPTATLQQRTGSDMGPWRMWAPMLALRIPDPAMGLPASTVLQPSILVRNTTAKKVSASITLNWRGDSSKGQVKLPEFDLDSFSTRQLQVGSMEKQLGIPQDAHWALVTLTSSGMPDDLIAVASSQDSVGHYNLETKFSGSLGGFFVGGEWRVDATHDQIVAITNGGARTTEALLTLHYDTGKEKYELQHTVPPGDQIWVNLSDLIHDRTPDRKGRVLPVDLSAVTWDLRDLTPGGHSLMENDLGVDHTWGDQIVPVPACPDCCGLTSVGFSPSFLNLPVGGDDTVEIDGVNMCSGAGEDITGDFGTWASEDAAIAKVSSAKVTGVAPGSTTGEAWGDIDVPGECGCNLSPVEETLPVTVLQVTITIQSSGTIPAADSARGAYYEEVGTYSLGNFVDSSGYCTIGYQATGTLAPSTYTGTVTLVRTKQGADYDGTTGQTLLDSYPTGTDDTSSATFEVTTPTNGLVYDLDGPGMHPAQNQIWRKRMNFFENAQLPNGTFVANEVGFYVRLSCKWGSSGNTFATDVAGDNVLGMGTTNTSWNLQ
jgi:hypothetical protein